MYSVSIERESIQYVFHEVIIDGEVILTDVEFAIVPTWERPGLGDWVAATVIKGYTACLVNAPALGGPGRFDIYSRHIGASETPVLQFTRLNIT